MNERNCEKCVWNGPEGCEKWDCEPLTREDLRKLLRERKEKDNA